MFKNFKLDINITILSLDEVFYSRKKTEIYQYKN